MKLDYILRSLGTMLGTNKVQAKEISYKESPSFDTYTPEQKQVHRDFLAKRARENRTGQDFNQDDARQLWPIADVLPQGVKEKLPIIPRSTPTPTQAPVPTIVFGSTKRNQETDNFLRNRVLPITRRYDLPDAVVAGMYAAEGRTGGLGASRNNYFNIGAFDSNLNNTHRYNTPEEGIEAYAKLLSGKYELGERGSGKFDQRYLPAYELRKDPVSMLRKIKELGYASREDYPEFIMSTPEWQENYK